MPAATTTSANAQNTTDSPRAIGQREPARPDSVWPNASTWSATGRPPQIRFKRLRIGSRRRALSRRAATSHRSTTCGDVERDCRGLGPPNTVLPSSDRDRLRRYAEESPAWPQTQPRHAPPVRPRRVGPPGGQQHATDRTSRVPSPDEPDRPREHPPQIFVAAGHPLSPKQLTRSETHACQKWSMTDLNPFTN